ncbi:MAG: hypothetical protein ACAH95_08645 [Fimbriimonas sp.]
MVLLLSGCGGSGGDTTEQTGTDALRGVWTATLDDRSQREVVAELTISGGTITGFLRLVENGVTYTGPVTGTYYPPHIQFTAQLEGHDPFTFETDTPLVVGGTLEGTFRFHANDHGRVILRREGDRSMDVAGEWTGTFESSEIEGLHGTWESSITQDGHRLRGTGKLVHEGHEYELTLAGSVVGRHVDLAAAIAGNRASLWRGEAGEEQGALRLRGRYLGRMTPGDGIDAGTINGSRAGGGGGGGDDHITIRPAELVLPPGGIETLHASRSNVEWSQQSEEAQPGEFVDLTENSARFRAPFIGGHILVKATAKENARIFGVSHVLVTGASGRIGDDRFHSVQGVAVRVVRNEHAFWVVEIPTAVGGIRLQTPFAEEPRRFELAPEQSTVGFTSEHGAFLANGREGAGGIIRYTRIGQGRLSGEFEATMRNREHPDQTLTISASFDVPVHRDQ